MFCQLPSSNVLEWTISVLNCQIICLNWFPRKKAQSFAHVYSIYSDLKDCERNLILGRQNVCTHRYYYEDFTSLLHAMRSTFDGVHKNSLLKEAQASSCVTDLTDRCNFLSKIETRPRSDRPKMLCIESQRTYFYSHQGNIVNCEQFIVPFHICSYQTIGGHCVAVCISLVFRVTCSVALLQTLGHNVFS